MDVADGKPDRPTEEPEEATQRDQYDLLRETGNERRDLTEEEEARLLGDVYGPPRDGIYGAPTGPGGDEEAAEAGEGER